jgi:hypothetical protein
VGIETKEGDVPDFAFALPVLPGREELDHQTLEEMDGVRRDEYEAALRDAGIRRHAVWHQETPDGTMAIVYMQADDEAGIATFGSSDAPFNRWFRDKMKEVHGIDISQPGAPVRKVHDVAR